MGQRRGELLQPKQLQREFCESSHRGVISAKWFRLDREIATGNKDIHSDAVVGCKLSTASGCGEGGPLPLYLMKKAAREQFTVHFTCRLQKPEVAHSSLRALTGQ